MGRFPIAGRGGRHGMSHSPPRYLSVPPPILRYKAPDLSSNPYFSLSSQYMELPPSDVTRVFPTQFPPVPIKNLKPSNPTEVILTNISTVNRSRTLRKKTSISCTTSGSPTASSVRQGNKAPSPTSVGSLNQKFPSHFPQSSSIAKPPFQSPEMSTLSSPHSDQPVDTDVDMDIDLLDTTSPPTPDNGRRDKKLRQ